MKNEHLLEIQKWLRPIQQALTLEAEKDFRNLLGREEYFNSFICRELLSCSDLPISSKYKSLLTELSESFSRYSAENEITRRRLVVRLRKVLYELSNKSKIPEPIKPPRLNFYSDQLLGENRINTLDKYDFDTPISQIKGIGPKIMERLSCLGIFYLKDILLHYPRDYIDYSSMRRIIDLNSGETATIIAKVRKCNGFVSPRNKNLAIFELHVQDQTARLKVTRFLAGKRFSHPANIKSQVKLYPPGSTVAISGLVKEGRFGRTFQDPLIEVMDSPNSYLKSKLIGRLLPVYSLTEGVSADRFRNLVDIALPIVRNWVDPLPNSILSARSLLPKPEAIFEIHRPTNQVQLNLARRRLIFEEFFFLQLGLLRRRLLLKNKSAPPLIRHKSDKDYANQFLNLLPFTLTTAQERVLNEIHSDLFKTTPMSRLVQGDVGSGKTVVAIAALLYAVQAGWQATLMAPTEVLAEQHYRNLCKWLPQLHVNVELLTGSTSKSKRRQIIDDLANGNLSVLVGTHALIEDGVSFLRLGLVVVDEQHRFGVRQRNRLLVKGMQPHLLTMTATPIPRTLALSIHGDLDVSQIDELPPGRTPIETRLVSASERDKAYQLIREQVDIGQRAYVVLPLVEESEKLDLRSAVEVHAQLSSTVFPELQVGLLHGRMNSLDKQSIINDFSIGKCQVLVSTTVVEVGVDVPEATVMLIEHADRFGLAQLHQLRGRVGRGAKKSYCLLVNDSNNQLARHRLEVLVRSNDGFEISEIDLRLRGPGQVLGTKQSGLPDLALASLADDGAILEESRIEAENLLNKDPELRKHLELKKILDEHWRKLSGNAQLN